MQGAGDCFLIETNIDEGGFIRKHLHVVLLDYEGRTGTTIIVDIESFESDKQDQTRLLNAGCHPFVKHKSFVNYRRAKTYSKLDLEKLVREGKAEPKEPMPLETLEYIISGMRESTRTRPPVKSYFENKYWDKLMKK